MLPSCLHMLTVEVAFFSFWAQPITLKVLISLFNSAGQWPFRTRFEEFCIMTVTFYLPFSLAAFSSRVFVREGGGAGSGNGVRGEQWEFCRPGLCGIRGHGRRVRPSLSLWKGTIYVTCGHHVSKQWLSSACKVQRLFQWQRWGLCDLGFQKKVYTCTRLL